jgi:cell wall assembly regulator SMI1
MRTELTTEIRRLEAILTAIGLVFQPAMGATSRQIEGIEQKIGYELSQDLKDFYRFSNGSNQKTWGIVFSDELTPCSFPDLEDAYQCWSWFSPYDQTIYNEWSDFSATRDGRIQPNHLHHRYWFPIAEFNGYSTSIYFDADPTASGNYGQIIVYQHDPDAIYYVADSFLEFLKTSNDLLEKHGSSLLLDEL